MASTVLSADEEQERLLDMARQEVRKQGYEMKRALDGSKLMDGMKCASKMLRTLKTSELSPSNYYDLWREGLPRNEREYKEGCADMDVTDNLRHLESFLDEERRHGKQKMSDLYELVQYAGAHILPRLYLLVTVGSVYIKSKETDARNVLTDMVELARGVQHPTRGLFLRHYLSSVAKDKLPDTGSEYDGDVMDSINFVLGNFTEMNKLWVRMQHQGNVREKKKREKERQQLRMLVGNNLVRLSQLEGMDEDIYKEKVLPAIMEQVLACRDEIAQAYLMDVVVQVFPDELHLHSLDIMLSTCSNLEPNVDISQIIVGLIDRLAAYADRSEQGIPQELKVFETFSDEVSKLVSNRKGMKMVDVLGLQASLLSLALGCYRDRVEYVDGILGFCKDMLGKSKTKMTSDVVEQVVRLLHTPIDTYPNVLTVLQMENYSPLMEFLPAQTRRSVARYVITSCVKNSTVVEDSDEVSGLLTLAQPLLVDVEGEEEDEEEFAEDQALLARVVHLFSSEDPDGLFKMCIAARKFFAEGGPRRIQHTLVPLLFRVMPLAHIYHDAQEAGEEEEEEEDAEAARSLAGKKLGRVFKFVHTSVGVIAKDNASLALRLFVNAALVADACDAEEMAYEFITQAFSLYEEHVSDSGLQAATISLITGAVQQMDGFSPENYDAIVTKCALLSSKLLKKPDQCLAVARCAHLFWAPPAAGEEAYRDGGRVLECLKKALRIAAGVMDAKEQVSLFISVLNTYLYFYQAKNTSVTVEHLNKLLDLIQTKMADMEGDAIGDLSLGDEKTSGEDANVFLSKTTAYIRSKKKNPGEDDPSYEEIRA